MNSKTSTWATMIKRRAILKVRCPSSVILLLAILTMCALEHPQVQQQQPPTHYGGPPPPSGSQGQPPLPPGWIAQWDNNSQRWYFLEQATGRTQWEHPSQYPTHGPAGHGMQPPSGGYQPSSQQGMYSHEQHQYVKEGEKKDKNYKGLAAGAVGGLAVGGLVGHAMGEYPASPYQKHNHRKEKETHTEITMSRRRFLRRRTSCFIRSSKCRAPCRLLSICRARLSGSSPSAIAGRDQGRRLRVEQ